MVIASSWPAPQTDDVAMDAEAVTAGTALERRAVVTPAAARRRRVALLEVRHPPNRLPARVPAATGAAAGVPAVTAQGAVPAATAADDGPAAKVVSGKAAVGRLSRARPVDVPEVIFTQVSARVFL